MVILFLLFQVSAIITGEENPSRIWQVFGTRLEYPALTTSRLATTSGKFL